MTEEDFQQSALSLPEAEAGSHMGHPDFRVRGKIFATLGYPGPGWGMVKVPLEEQARLTAEEPTVYIPVKGAWGKRGATTVRLEAAERFSLHRAMIAAWRNV